MTRRFAMPTAASSVIVFALILAGCGVTPYGDEARRIVSESGARVADTTLENVEWYLCNAAPIGSLRRKYGSDPQLASAYRALCVKPGDEDVIGGPSTEE
jgi:hypothetical protein